MIKKEFSWNIGDVTYTVLNVPTYISNTEEDESFSIDVTIKLAMIRDLMVSNEIPHIVNYDDIADFEPI